MLLDRWTESRLLCEEAVAMARAVGARQVEGHALNTLGLDMAVSGECQASFAPLEQAIAIAREVANADDVGRAYANLSEAQRYCGDIRGALETARQGAAVAEEMGLTWTYGSFLRSNAINYCFDLGEWEEARRWAEESVAIQPPGRAQRRYGLAHWVQLLVATEMGVLARSSMSCAPCSRGFRWRASSTPRFASRSPRPRCGGVNQTPHWRRSVRGCARRRIVNGRATS
jgi:tetratricopeptide (TPR) repeat protein